MLNISSAIISFVSQMVELNIIFSAKTSPVSESLHYKS